MFLIALLLWKSISMPPSRLMPPGDNRGGSLYFRARCLGCNCQLHHVHSHRNHPWNEPADSIAKHSFNFGDIGFVSHFHELLLDSKVRAWLWLADISQDDLSWLGMHLCLDTHFVIVSWPVHNVPSNPLSTHFVPQSHSQEVLG